MKNKSLLLIALLVATIFSCDDDDNDPVNNVCENNYVSDAIVTAFATANGFNAIYPMDLETHEYTIMINANGEICSIGYKNSPTYAGSYNMEIINVTSGNSYSGSHSFSQTNLDYQTITPTISVATGDVINVKRTIEPGYTPLLDEIGDAIASSNPTISFPIVEGNVTFLGSDFYGGGGPVTDYAMPIIGLGFKVN